MYQAISDKIVTRYYIGNWPADNILSYETRDEYAVQTKPYKLNCHPSGIY